MFVEPEVVGTCEKNRKVLASHVVGIQQYLIRPNVANTNDNFLSSEILLEPSITEELVRKSLSLDYVIFQKKKSRDLFLLLRLENSEDSSARLESLAFGLGEQAMPLVVWHLVLLGTPRPHDQ
ncbi:hypothetical protein RUM43_012643 [Polyplax serrata]|uniref:Uncharacterized protein n=1 Tax=Polyplax serrata TaxID=468196 RepID=A0AAN8PHY5_POLSC